MGKGGPNTGNGRGYFIGGLLCIAVAVGSFVTFGGHFRSSDEERVQLKKADLPRVEQNRH